MSLNSHSRLALSFNRSMFTVWGPPVRSNHSSWFSVQRLFNLRSIHWGSSAPMRTKETALALPCTPLTLPFYLISCECHVVLSGTFACVAANGGEVCLSQCDRKKKNQPPALFAVWFGVISTYCDKHARSLWLVTCCVREPRAVCAKWYAAMATRVASSRESLIDLALFYITTTA